MRIRKMRRYKSRRRSVIRLKRRAIRRRGSKKAEVKVFTYQTYEQTLRYIVGAVGYTTLWNSQRFIGNIFAGIIEGAGRDQRIGHSIFVKHITMTLWIRGCPATEEYSVGTFYVRCQLANTGATRAAIGSDVAGYFRTIDEINFNGIIDQSEIHLQSDRTYQITAHEGPNWSTIDYTFNGPARRIVYKVPINRTVTYQRDSNTVKDNKDFLCFNVLTGGPGMSTATNNQQIGCMDATVSVYYVDP